MTRDWTPEALADEQDWRSCRREMGMCPDSGLTLTACRTSICDCWWTPTQEPAESGHVWHPGATQPPNFEVTDLTPLIARMDAESKALADLYRRPEDGTK